MRGAMSIKINCFWWWDPDSWECRIPIIIFIIMLYPHIQLYLYIYNYMRKHSQQYDDFNERTNTLLYKNISLKLHSQKGCERVDAGYVWEVSWRRGQTATYWPKALLATIAALLPHFGWAAQPWVAEGPSPLSGAWSHSAGILSPTATGTELELTQAVCGTW